jgi:hypothetical protein
MRRREFIGVLRGAAAWPLVARALFTDDKPSMKYEGKTRCAS